MPKFEKQYVYFMWSDELEGKMVFFADYIPQLKQRVEDTIISHYAKVTKGEGNLPFRIVAGLTFSWAFAYYDPYYELKLAHEHGHKIQVLAKGNDKWADLWLDLPNPDWELEPEMYRVKTDGPAPKLELAEKPELALAPITNRGLAQWLAEGYGQYMDVDFKVARTYYCYDCCEASADDAQINKDIRVRLWGDTEWHVPTRKYMYMPSVDDEDQE